MIAVLIGATILSPAQYGMIYLILLLFGFLMSACATTIALYLGDHDSYSAFNTMISMPLFFTSSALMPYNVMPAWLRTIAHAEPAELCNRCGPCSGNRDRPACTDRAAYCFGRGRDRDLHADVPAGDGGMSGAGWPDAGNVWEQIQRTGDPVDKTVKIVVIILLCCAAAGAAALMMGMAGTGTHTSAAGAPQATVAGTTAPALNATGTRRYHDLHAGHDHPD